MPESNPVSFRLTDEATKAIKDCEDLSGLKRSAVVEMAIRRFRDYLRKQAEKKSGVGA